MAPSVGIHRNRRSPIAANTVLYVLYVPLVLSVLFAQGVIPTVMVSCCFKEVIRHLVGMHFTPSRRPADRLIRNKLATFSQFTQSNRHTSGLTTNQACIGQRRAHGSMAAQRIVQCLSDP